MRAAVDSTNPVESWHGAQVGQPLCVTRAIIWCGRPSIGNGFCKGPFGIK